MYVCMLYQFFPLTNFYTKIKETSLPDFWSIAGDRIIGFMPFPKLFVLYEMQTASFMI